MGLFRALAACLFLAIYSHGSVLMTIQKRPVRFKAMGVARILGRSLKNL